MWTEGIETLTFCLFLFLFGCLDEGFAPYLEQIDQIEENVNQLEEATKQLDEYSKKLGERPSHFPSLCQDLDPLGFCFCPY